MTQKSTKEKTLVIYGLDDTLFPSSHFYTKAKIKLLDITLGKDRNREQSCKILSQFREIENNNFSIHGNSPISFATSLRQTYENWKIEHSSQINTEISHMLYDIGINVMNAKVINETGLCRGAKILLHYHKQRGDRVVLLTNGHRQTQEMKIEKLGLENMFHEIKVVKDKNEGEFAKYSNYHGNKITIGAHLDKDIAPALNNGFSGIYIPNIVSELAPHVEVPTGVLTVDGLSKLLNHFEHYK